MTIVIANHYLLFEAVFKISYKVNKYMQIRKGIKDTVLETRRTGKFDFLQFYRQMEALFTANGFRESTPPPHNDVKSILVIRLDAIGDFVLTTGFIRELRLNYPSARITLVVSDFVYPLAELCPYVNRVEPFNMKSLTNDLTVVLKHLADFAAEKFWHEHYDLAFSVQWGSNNKPPLLMAYLSGARERIGYGYQIELLHFDKLPPKEQDVNYLLLTKPVINPKEIVHEADHHLYVLQAMNLSVRSKDMELWYSAEDVQNARKLLSEINPGYMKIAVGIGAGGGSRKYPVEQYISAFKDIVKIMNGKICFVIIGGKAEAEDARKFQLELPEGCVLNLVERTTLRETVATISQMNMFIGNDTGVMHMAAALHIPIIAVFRQPKDKDSYVPAVFSEYERFAPWRSDLSIVLRPDHTLDDCKNVNIYGGCKYPYPHCITQVKSGEIVEAFNNMLYIMQHNLSK